VSPVIRGTVYLFNGGQLTASHSEHEIFAQFALIADEKIELGILPPEFHKVVVEFGFASTRPSSETNAQLSPRPVIDGTHSF